MLPSFGAPELVILVMIAVFGIIPWVAAIWALITLYRMRGEQAAIRTTLERIEQQLQRR